MTHRSLSFPFQIKPLVSAIALSLSVASLLPGTAMALAMEPVISEDGTHYANLYLEIPGQIDEKASSLFGYQPAERDLSAQEIGALKLGVDYFWEVLKTDFNGHTPVNILLIGMNAEDANASAASLTSEDGSMMSELGAQWQTGSSYYPYTAFISIDRTQYDDEWNTDPITILPLDTLDGTLSGTMMHELYHAFGLFGIVWIEPPSNEPLFLKQYINLYSSQLYDIYGRSLANVLTLNPDGRVNIIGVDSKIGEAPTDPSQFYVLRQDSYSGVYFSGPQVREVLDDALIAWPEYLVGDKTAITDEMEPVPGLPINGFEGNYLDVSHIELQNSLMSHQWYRNWSVLMEAELALLQDIGYNFDRKRFYGFSIYNNDTNIVNTQGYWARNEDGTDWLYGQPSTQKWGIGLHIYGSNNTVRQAADLLANGDDSIGVRVDGSTNDLTIASGVRIEANGQGSKGIAFSWGKNHNLTIEKGASVSATGQDGIAVAFDFGSNALGNYICYFGSYTGVTYSDSQGGMTRLDYFPDVLDGPLVDKFKVSGSLKGDFASIYISPNAFVKNIVIEPGSKIEGDILSLWDPDHTPYGTKHSGNDANDSLITTITFGSDIATRSADSKDSAIEFDDLIFGPLSLKMELSDATLRFDGLAAVVSVEVAANATLEGGTYLLMPSKHVANPATLVNEGHVISTSLSPVSISGNYRQSQSASLTLSVQDGLFVPMRVDGEAQIEDGSNVIATLEGGWQPSGSVTVDTASDIIQAQDFSHGQLNYTYKQTSEMAPSPTLEINGSTEGWEISRAKDAYSRYVSGEAQKVAAIFDVSADGLTEETSKALFAMLDWSDTDGQLIEQASNALMGDGLMDGTAAAMNLERLADLALGSRLSFAQADGNYAWVNPFGATVSARMIGKVRQDVAGIAGGWIHKTGSNETGLSVAALQSEGKSANARELDAKGIWVSGYWKESDFVKPGVFAELSARLGYINSDQSRQVSFSGFADSLESDADYWSMGLSAQSGFTFKLRDSLQLEPYVGLSGFVLYSSSFDESDVNGAALSVDSEVYRSLEAQIGLKAEGAVFTPSKAYWQLHASYGRELLSDAGSMDLRFKAPDLKGGFSRDVQFDSKDRLRAGLKVGIENKTGLSFNARLDGQWESSDTRSVAGGIEATWRF